MFMQVVGHSTSVIRILVIIVAALTKCLIGSPLYIMFVSPWLYPLSEMENLILCQQKGLNLRTLAWEWLPCKVDLGVGVQPLSITK